MSETSRPASDRTTVRRLGKRGVYDRASVYAILDEALYCHVGFVDAGQPFVIPTIHARMGDRLVLHGSRASRMLHCLSAGAAACITVTILDGLVLARSTFHHSMNYRSVVVLGQGSEIVAADEKSAALEALVERIVPGRAAEARAANEQELQATAVIAFPLDECSAKLRVGPPVDDADDLALPVWAGVLPLRTVCGEPQPDPQLPAGTPVPRYIREYRRA